MEELLAANREFKYCRQDFRRTAALAASLAGITIAESKYEFVYSRLARHVRASRLTSVGAYLDLVESDRTKLEEFINALTTNLTSFFREPHHFAALRAHAKSARHPLRVWSAACSTGEEAYSIAMTLDALDLPWGPLLASDIDTACLATARAGVYHVSAISSLPNEYVRRYMLQGTGKAAGAVRVRKGLRERIDFRRVNLADDTWNIDPCSVIFCRNVLIYFERAAQRRIVQHLWETLEPDGLLMTGHAENLAYAEDIFERVGTTVYRKRGRASNE